MTREKMLEHAEHWIAAWNRRDVQAMLRAFAPSASFISPKAAGFVNFDDLEFRLDHVLRR